VNRKIDHREVDEKVTRVMKYGISLGLLLATIMVLLESLTGFTGKMALYSSVVLSIVGLLVFVIFGTNALIQLRRMKKI
jgi:hypothetical protein